MKVGRNRPAGFAVITVSSTGHNLTPRIMTKFVVHTLAARCNAVPLASANKCFGLAVNCFNQVSKSLFRQQLETWSQLEPGKLFRASPKKTTTKMHKHRNVSDHEPSRWKYKTERWMYYKTRRKRGKKLCSPGCSCARLLRAARWSAEGAEAAEIVVRTSSRSGPGSGYYGSWRSTGGSPLGSSWAAVSSERADSVLCAERQSERERKRERVSNFSKAAMQPSAWQKWHT